MSPDAERLVELARHGDGPTAEDRARVRRGIATALAAATSVVGAGTAAAKTGAVVAAAGAKSIAGGSTVAAGTVTVGKVASWLGVGMAAGLAGALTVSAVTTPSKPSAPVAAVAPRVQNAPASPKATRLPLTVRQAAAQEAPAEPESSPAAVAHPQQRSAPIAPRLLPSALAEETELLEQAQSALARGDAAAALRLLERHERRFPAGALSEERLAGRVLALCQLGRVADARRSAERLRAVAPQSPLWPRLRQACPID